MDAKKLALENESYVIERRRYYHQHPELSDKEKETIAAIKADLEALGITDITMIKKHYGLFADIKGGKPGKCVALRSDIDALPIQEETGAEYASLNDGAMHACGHDTHIAMLLGAAKILNEHKDELCGTVRLIFQPSEETCEGSSWMIDEGCLEGVDAIYGAHIWGNFDAGLIDVTPGPRMACVGLFYITVEGVSAHGSAPNLGVDAIVCGSAIVQACQTYVSRINNPLEPLVFTIGTFNGGTRFNVIPNKVEMSGTLRSFHSDKHKEILENIIVNVGKAYGCKATLNYIPTSEAVINDEELTALCRKSAEKLFDAERMQSLPLNMGSEDFSYYGAKIPGTFVFLGSRNKAKGITATNHQEKFDVDEDVLKDGTALEVQFAIDYLEANK